MFVCPECGHAAGAPGFCTEHGVSLIDAGADPLPGQRVGSYRIARLIGEGGMGRVYLAVQPEIGSRVAVKVLSGDATAGSASVERFFAEARAVNVIRHENIVSVLDLSRLPDGRPYIVMEYLEGAALSTLIAERGALPLGALTRALGEVLDALAAAHEKGIVHRDLKPDNIFITRGGRAKVLDFGIAKLKPELLSMEAHTSTGALLGTPHYMSPEQAQGRPAEPRSDLYSVGVILFEGATGTRPFDASSLYELLKQHIEHPPPSPRSMRGDLPPAYEAVILRALDKSLARRFQNARELSAALAEAGQSAPADSWGSLGSGRAPLGPAPTPDPERRKMALEATVPTPPAHGTAPTPQHAAAGRTPMQVPAGTPPPTYPSAGNAPAVPDALYEPQTLEPVVTQNRSSTGLYLLVGAILLFVGASIVVGAVVGFVFNRTPPPPPGPPPVASPRRAPEPAPTPTGVTNTPMPFAGNYVIAHASNPGNKKAYGGNIEITHRGSRFHVTWTGGVSADGVGLSHGDLLGVGWAYRGSYAVVMYDVDGGKLDGRWVTQSDNAQPGVEVLRGPAGLDGRYHIVSAHPPGSTRAYGGTVVIHPRGSTYHLKWEVDGHVYQGVGILQGRTLVAGWGLNAGVAVYRRRDQTLEGSWALPGGTQLGSEILRRR
jgi:serine/threonine-protein kinase